VAAFKFIYPDMAIANDLIFCRPATDNDFSVVYELYMDETSNPYLTYDSMDKQEFKGIYDEMLSTGTLFVAESEYQVVGTYRLIRKTYRQADTVYIGGFAVARSHKGKGVGTAILNHIKKEATAKGVKRLELTVDSNNKAAIGLYEKAGFEKEGTIRKSYKLVSTGEYYDEYLMALIL
jgi:putative acetyltransferase